MVFIRNSGWAEEQEVEMGEKTRGGIQNSRLQLLLDPSSGTNSTPIVRFPQILIEYFSVTFSITLNCPFSMESQFFFCYEFTSFSKKNYNSYL